MRVNLTHIHIRDRKYITSLIASTGRRFTAATLHGQKNCVNKYVKVMEVNVHETHQQNRLMFVKAIDIFRNEGKWCIKSCHKDKSKSKGTAFLLLFFISKSQ